MVTVAFMEAVMEAVTAEVMEVATAAAIAAEVTTSAAGIMAVAIFTAGRRISVRSPHIVRSLRNA